MVAPPVSVVSSGLPPPCLTVAEQPTEKALVTESTLSQPSFPNEFPYEFDYSSLGDSTETEDETSDDEDDFLAGLTRRLAFSTQRLPSSSLVTDKAKVKPVKSSESTPSGLESCITSGNRSPNGPFSQVYSPPTSPFREEDSLKVISAVAGEFKMANFDAKPNTSPNPNSFISVPHQNAAFYDYYWLWSSHYHQSRIGLQSTLQPSSIASPYPGKGIFAAPNTVKQPSAGTGVFLPRKYPNPSDSQKKSGGGSVKLPKKVVHQQKPKNEKFSGRCQPHSQARLSTGRSKINYESKKTSQIRSVSGGCLKEERHLPQEWMY